MKKYIYIFSLLLGIVTFNSCDLDKLPSGDLITEGQKEDVINPSPEKLEADINGITAALARYDVLNRGDVDYDYGFPAVCLILESLGQDLWGPASGYNWFSTPQEYADKTLTSMQSEFLWRTFYYHILACNSILEFAPEGTEDGNLKNYRAQALAFRAFDYLNLIQIYQFTYVGNEDQPGVPLILEPKEPLGYGNSRVTVKEVYTQILNDLNEAIELLDGVRRPESDKSKVDQGVAYGLRARVHLLMQNWKEAADDAQRAMIGYTPATLEEVSIPGFNTISAKNWMWGVLITPETGAVKTGIVNWPSHLCSFTGNGYTTAVAMYKSANKNLWNKIPKTDIRKDWFVYYPENYEPEDPDEPDNSLLRSLLVDSLDVVFYNRNGEEISAAEYYDWNELTNVKFHAYENKVDNPTNASDWPLMRVEEMILIRAEALGMNGELDEAKKVLEDFVSTYRNEEFKSNASSPEELQDEVWLQRRIEFWGEGLSFFDLMRLKKGVNRVENGESSFPSLARFNIAATDPVLLYLIPEKEINVNDALTPEDNNPSAVAPKPIK